MNQIKQIELSTGKWLLVTVPAGSSPFLDNVFGYIRFRMCENFVELPVFPDDIDLPAGHLYTLVGKASELSEDQWKEIVPNDLDLFYAEIVILDYRDYTGEFAGFSRADRSGFSLLKAHGLSHETTVIIKIN